MSSTTASARPPAAAPLRRKIRSTSSSDTDSDEPDPARRPVSRSTARRCESDAADSVIVPVSDRPCDSRSRPRRTIHSSTFDKTPDLFGETLPDPAADRSRALMWDLPRYLQATHARGRPVLGRVVENVTEVRQWARWHEWITAIRNLGYSTRHIALNSMHAQPSITPPAPQSRDRLYLAYLDDLRCWTPDSGRIRASGSANSVRTGSVKLTV